MRQILIALVLLACLVGLSVGERENQEILDDIYEKHPEMPEMVRDGIKKGVDDFVGLSASVRRGLTESIYQKMTKDFNEGGVNDFVGQLGSLSKESVESAYQKMDTISSMASRGLNVSRESLGSLSENTMGFYNRTSANLGDLVIIISAMSKYMAVISEVASEILWWLIMIKNTLITCLIGVLVGCVIKTLAFVLRQVRALQVKRVID